MKGNVQLLALQLTFVSSSQTRGGEFLKSPRFFLFTSGQLEPGEPQSQRALSASKAVVSQKKDNPAGSQKNK